MSEDITADAGEHSTDQAMDQVKEFDAITSQDDFDKRIQARIDRERKRFGDYDDLKARAAKLDEIEEANKTEAQKLADRAEAAEKRAAEYESKAMRSDVAADKGVPVALLSGSTKEELEASADALLAFRGEQKSAPSSPSFGRVNSVSAEPDLDARIAEAEKARNFPLAITLKQQKAAMAAATNQKG